ncbi:MAG: SpoIIE family protein phosphatase [Bacilli bacterium]
MELVKSKNRTLYFLKNNIDIFDIFIMVLSICITLIHDAFMFNPILIALFYLSYKKGWLITLITYLLTLSFAFIKNINYGFEILIIESFYLCLMLLSTYVKIFNKKYFSPLIICLSLSIVTLITRFNYQLLFLCFLNSFISILTIQAFLSFNRKLKDNYKGLTILHASLVIAVISIAFMFNNLIGLVFFRLFILLNMKDSKTSNNILSLVMGSILLYYFCNISSYLLLYVLIPLLLTSFINGRYKIVFYIFIHILLSLTLDPIFYQNNIFYQGLASALLYLLIPVNYINKVQELFNDRIIKKEYDESLENEVLRITHYIDAISLGFDKKRKEPLIKAYYRVKARVCNKCTHRSNCKIKDTLEGLLSKKLTSSERKKISEDCVYPFKLVMEIQQAYEIYLAEQSYFLDVNQQIKNINNVLGNIKEPLLAFLTHKKEFDNKHQLIFETCNALSSNAIDDIYINDNNIEFIKKIKAHVNIEEIENVINMFNNHSFSFIYSRKDYLTNQEHIIFQKKRPSEFIYNVYTKALDLEYNGDSTLINQDSTYIKFLLADGMGHGKSANEISQLLIKMFSSLLLAELNTTIILEQINTILRASYGDDNYSTIDFLQINKETLKGRFIKMGSVNSLVFRNNEKIIINQGGLPIGLIEQCELEVIDFDFEHKDIVFLFSDGLLDFISNFDYTKYIEIEDINLMGRVIFKDATKNIEHPDDMTLIVINVL